MGRDAAPTGMTIAETLPFHPNTTRFDSTPLVVDGRLVEEEEGEVVDQQQQQPFHFHSRRQEPMSNLAMYIHTTSGL